MRRLQTHPRAIKDIDDIAEYIAAQSPQAADDFFTCVDVTVQSLGRYPGAGHVITDDPVRVWARHLVKFHNHFVLYRYDERAVIVLRVVHGARDLPRVFADLDYSWREEEPGSASGT